MSKDFLIGFLFAIVILLILFMVAPDSPSTKRRKRQPVARRGDWGENLTDDERDLLRKAGAR